MKSRDARQAVRGAVEKFHFDVQIFLRFDRAIDIYRKCVEIIIARFPS